MFRGIITIIAVWVALGGLLLVLSAPREYTRQQCEHPAEHPVQPPEAGRAKSASVGAGSVGSPAERDATPLNQTNRERLLLTAAHVVHVQREEHVPTFADSVYFFPAWNGAAPPQTLETAVPLRGFHVMAGYVDAVESGETVQRYGNQWEVALARDFAAGWSYENLAGGAAPVYKSGGGDALRSLREKMLTGYPTGLYDDGHPGQWRMHRLGPFNRPLIPTVESFYMSVLHATARGNSGGPVWVKDSREEWGVAGISVAGVAIDGNDYFLGTVAIRVAEWELIQQVFGEVAPAALERAL